MFIGTLVLVPGRYKVYTVKTQLKAGQELGNLLSGWLHCERKLQMHCGCFPTGMSAYFTVKLH
jgi:hypothetical protein